MIACDAGNDLKGNCKQIVCGGVIMAAGGQHDG